MRSVFAVVMFQLSFQTGFSASAEGECILVYCQADACNGSLCTRCKGGYYLDTTTDSDRHWCKPCHVLQTCSACNGTDDCSGCNTGHYGYRCERNCSLSCKDNICEKDSGSCVQGCIDGYYQTDGRCTQCPSKCSNCSSSELCSSCHDANLWGEACQYTCDNCVSCYKLYGFMDGCNGGYFREYDSDIRGFICNKCPGNCLSCTSLFECRSCKSGYWGPNCQYSCFPCKDKVCSKNYGCTRGCIDGYYLSIDFTTASIRRRILQGQQCIKEYKCIKCLDICKICIENSTCFECKDSNLYGALCDQRCSKNCAETHGRVCGAIQGECVNGCKAGWFGSHCNAPCNENCKDHICDRINGSCKTGCMNGFTGNMCTRAMKSPWYDGSFFQGLGIGLGITVLSVVLICTSMTLFFRRRLARLSSEGQSSVRMEGTERIDLNDQNSNQAANYENVDRGTTLSPDDDANSNQCAPYYEEIIPE